MYEVYTSASPIQTYISSVVATGLNWCIGEFGVQNNGINVDVDDVMAQCQSNNISYMGWSWCGNGSCCTLLDQVNSWNVNSMTSWGTRLFTGTNGIKSTSKECTIFSGTQTVAPTSVPTVAPTVAPTSAPSCSLKGDVNGSGAVDIVDALLIAQYYVGLNPSNFNSNCADVNCSGGIDVVDALLIAQKYVGLIANFPC
jgi:mannan endo-1,4-beta-mannosidase